MTDSSGHRHPSLPAPGTKGGSRLRFRSERLTKEPQTETQHVSARGPARGSGASSRNGPVGAGDTEAAPEAPVLSLHAEANGSHLRAATCCHAVTGVTVVTLPAVPKHGLGAGSP